MTYPSAAAGIPAACRTRHVPGWQLADDDDDTEGLGFQVFTGILTWVSPAARQEWYEELSRLCYESYEMFGHTLDALKILAAGGVEARFLAMQR